MTRKDPLELVQESIKQTFETVSECPEKLKNARPAADEAGHFAEGLCPEYAF
jgi:hypothetical protein